MASLASTESAWLHLARERPACLVPPTSDGAMSGVAANRLITSTSSE